MADGVEVKLTGLDSLLGKMSAISEVTQSKAGRFALRKAANVIRDRARNNARRVDDPLTREAIHKNIIAKFDNRAYRQTGNISFRVGILGGARATRSSIAARKAERRRARLGQRSLAEMGEIAGYGKGNPGGETYYWRFLEFGTEHAAAQPIMRPAMNGADMEVINTFSTEFEKAIDRAIERGSKTGGAGMTVPVYPLCASSAAVRALIGNEPRIYPFGGTDDDIIYPYAVWRNIGGVPENYLATRPDADHFSIQIDVYADTEKEAEQVAKAIRNALELKCYITRWGDQDRDTETKRYRYSFDADWIINR